MQTNCILRVSALTAHIDVYLQDVFVNRRFVDIIHLYTLFVRDVNKRRNSLAIKFASAAKNIVPNTLSRNSFIFTNRYD